MTPCLFIGGPWDGRRMPVDTKRHSRFRVPGEDIHDYTEYERRQLLAGEFFYALPGLSNCQVTDKLMAGYHPVAPKPAPQVESTPSTWFTNHYECPKCAHEWTDEWYHGSDDECPKCGCKNISPTESIEA